MSEETKQYFYVTGIIVALAVLGAIVPPISWVAWSVAFLASLTLLTVTVKNSLQNLQKNNQK